MNADLLRDIMLLAGAAAMTWGVWQLSPACGWIFLGGVLAAPGVLHYGRTSDAEITVGQDDDAE